MAPTSACAKSILRDYVGVTIPVHQLFACNGGTKHYPACCILKGTKTPQSMYLAVHPMTTRDTKAPTCTPPAIRCSSSVKGGLISSKARELPGYRD